MSGRQGKKRKKHEPKVTPESGQEESPKQSTPDPTQEPPKQTLDSPLSDDGTSPVKPRWRLTPLAVAEVGLVLTAVIAVIYYFQLRSMQDSVRLTGLALEADQRPWAKLDYGKTQLVSSLPVIQQITITDIGKTPLLRLRAHLAMELVPNGSPPKFDWNRAHMESKVPILLPNSPNVIPAELRDSNDALYIVTPAEIDDIKAGQLVLLTYARVAYDDTLGVGHWQQFCNWTAFPGVDQLNQTVTHTKCAEFNDTEKQKKTN
jgi:hypothetical protein